MSLSMPFLQGFLLCISMIFAVGPQNTYVLRQGALGRHILITVLVCSICDILLISMGAFGLAYSIGCIPWLRQALLWGGVIFIGNYAFKSFRRAVKGNYYQSLQVDGADVASRWQVALRATGFSLLNPHVILDTVVMIGGMALQFAEKQRFEFVLGASIASICWFAILGIFARILSKTLQNPTAMRIFDGGIGLLMVWIISRLWTEL